MAPDTAPSQSPKSDTPPLQFTLRHLFLLTGCVAVVAALGVGLGPSVVPLSIGMLLAFANLAGYCDWFQQSSRRPRVVSLAWLMFVVSMFLPATEGCNGSTIPGWATAYQTALMEVEVTKKLITDTKPEQMLGVLFFTLLNAANLMFLFSPLMIRRLNRGKGGRMACATAVATGSVWLVPINFASSGMLSGYYVWAASFTTMMLTYRIRLPTYIAMGAIAAAYLLLHVFE